MAALNIFGKKEEQKKEKPQKKEKSASTADAPKRRSEQQETANVVTAKGVEKKERKGAQISAGSQLVRAHITEKATDLAGHNQYVFVVIPGASKKEIEHSIESAYGVIVKRVRIINVRAKSVRLGKTRGTKSGYKKAIVTIQEGQSIEVLPT